MLFSFKALLKKLVDLVVSGREKGLWKESNKPRVPPGNERRLP